MPKYWKQPLVSVVSVACLAPIGACVLLGAAQAMPQTGEGLQSPQSVIVQSQTETQASVVAAAVIPVGETTLSGAMANSACDEGVTQLTDEEISEILRVHNEARAEVGVAPLTWNCTLAEFAQSWADQDVWEHSSQSQREGIIPDSYVGENLAAAAPADRTLSDWGAVDWYGEIADWDNDSGTCAAGKVCGHYTQMVWQNTTEIGCGINRSSSVMGSEWANNSVYLVCNYNPGGNYGGERPY